MLRRIPTWFMIGILVTFWEQPVSAQSSSLPDLNVLSGIAAAAGLGITVDTGNHRSDWLFEDGSSLIMRYPGGFYSPETDRSKSLANYGFVAIHPGENIVVSPAPKPGVDVSSYQALVLRMRSESIAIVGIGIKDARQPDNGSETKILISLTSQWQTYYIPLPWFIKANPKEIYFLTEFVFQGSAPQTVQVSTIDYTTKPPALTKILPHFVYGGGWSTTLSFTNSSDATVLFPVSFFDSAGNPMYVPIPNSGSLAVGLSIRMGPRTTAVVSFPNADSTLNAGYVSAGLPTDIAAYATLKRSLPGQPDQKISVPFSNSTTRSSMFVFDETGSGISASVVNPGNSDVNIAIRAWDASGRLLGEGSLNLPSRTKQTLVLKDVSGLSEVAGKRGTVDFVVGPDFIQSSGYFAVLALSTDGVTLTSVPSTDR